MDGVGGFLILIVIGVIALLAKVQEQKAEETKRQERKTRPASAEDLPERTRRMLYDDTEVPEARPRSADPSAKESPWDEATPLEPREVRVAKRREETVTVAPPPVAAPPRRRVVVAGPPTTPTTTARISEDADHVRRRQEISASRKERITARETRPQRKRTHTPHRVASDVDSAKREAAHQRLVAARQAASRKTAAQERKFERHTCITALLRSGNDVRRGIVVSEILQPPIALRN